MVEYRTGRGSSSDCTTDSWTFSPIYTVPMASIRDLVDAVRSRDGVEAAIVLGRDGLLVDGETVSYLDGEQVAAHSPAVFAAADALGKAARAGQLQTAVLEFPGTIAIISAMSEDALLVVLARPTAALPPLLGELRRLRQHIASLA